MLPNFAYSVDDITEILQKSITLHDTEINEIKNLENKSCTLENTFLRIDALGAHITNMISPVFLLKYVSPDKALRDASKQAEIEINNACNNDTKDVILFQKCMFGIKSVPESKLSADLQRLIARFVSSYKRNGIREDNMNDSLGERLQSLKQLQDDTVELDSQFDSNINERIDIMEFSLDDLDGLPDDFISRIRSDENPDVYRINLINKGDVIAILKYATSRDVRKSCWNRTMVPIYKNYEIFIKILQNRQKIINLLGYSSWIEYRVSDNTIKTENEITDLLSSFSDGLYDMYKHELGLLAKTIDLDVDDFWPWDRMYATDQYMKQYAAVDSMKIREYYPHTYTQQKIFDFFAHVLSVKFIEKEIDASTWWIDPSTTPGVHLYEVHDARSGNNDARNGNNDARSGNNDARNGNNDSTNGDKTSNSKSKLLGYIAIDIFPRDNKYNHAMCTTVQISSKYNDEVPMSAVVMNLSAPDPETGVALFMHRDVSGTYMHEFGHAIHHILSCSRDKYAGQSGINQVALDFVETPSQMIENWGDEPYVIRYLSKHYKTGNVMPDEMINSLYNNRKKFDAMMWINQSVYANLDLNFNKADYQKTELTLERLRIEFIRLLTRITKNKNIPKNTEMVSTFGHLTEYSAQYYSYLLSKVICSDFYSLFSDIKSMDDPRLTEIGIQYRQKVLESTGTKSEIDIIRDFIGRDYSVASFIKSITDS